LRRGGEGDKKREAGRRERNRFEDAARAARDERYRTKIRKVPLVDET